MEKLGKLVLRFNSLCKRNAKRIVHLSNRQLFMNEAQKGSKNESHSPTSTRGATSTEKLHGDSQSLKGASGESAKTERSKKIADLRSSPGNKVLPVDDNLVIPISLWDAVDADRFKQPNPNQTSRTAAAEDHVHAGNTTQVARDTTILNDTTDSVLKDNTIVIAPPVPACLHEKSIPTSGTVDIFVNKDNVLLPYPMVLRAKPLSVKHDGILSTSNPGCKLPSVTQVLKDTMSQKSEVALALWRKKKIAEVGIEGFNDYMREAKTTGTDLHASIETCLRGVDYTSVQVQPRIAGHWLSLKSVLASIEGVAVLESYVVHPHLKYKGYVDCVAWQSGRLCVVEWKTSQRRKNTLQSAYDDPVQLAAYIGAINADERYPFEVENALLVVAYPTGRPADVIQLDRRACEKYWIEWLKRLEAFHNSPRSAKSS